ncbi:HsdM family class I SAM-dependent methyltransferase [Aureispira anguillae]|uniref:site-specific DNA-methyltransferase (adenine-specific) n=1 Tax=Aureispira anguillae TaxID=2864201 RepID=A0A915YJW0_9BACT|nr:SAM-dependent methyltransferase [Aureispira anguillae]BDS14549.1 SAM-dependent methyltransferase [Aureispira anguillae]
MQNPIIKAKVQSLWDRLWAGGLSNPITAIEQISFLLFMKRLEKIKPDINEEHVWSFYRGIKGEKLVKHVKEDVFEYIKIKLANESEPFAKAMVDATFRITNPTLLEDAIQFIDDIYIEIEKEEAKNQYFQDIQGDLYEHLLRHTSEAGKNGQFRTPRHIIQMMCEMLDPDFDGKICDLASGSAGFLVGAYQYIITKYSEEIKSDENGLPKGLDGNKLDEAQKKKLKEETFFGFDIDQTMVRIGMMNLMMHGITKPNIIHLDTLSEEYENYESNRTLDEISDAFQEGKLEFTGSINEEEGGMEVTKIDQSAEKYSYILANPPFTGKINSLTVSENLDRTYPPKYKEDKRVKQTVQSELLFLERIVFMLEVGGRAAVIVPEGVLFNAGKAHKKIREILMMDCNLQGIVSLPEGAFLPYTGVKTSILLFEKRELRGEVPQSIDVWFYELKSDGYSLDSNRRRLKESPLPIAINEWKERNKKNQNNKKLQHFSIPFEEIKQNGFELNFNLYKEFIYENQSLRKPDSILDQLSELEKEILVGIEDLKK